MKISVEKIPVQGLFLEFGKAAEEFPVLWEMEKGGECRFLSPIMVQMKVGWVRDMVEAIGFVETQVSIPCRRCIEPVELPLKRDFSIYFTRNMPELDAPAADEGTEMATELVGLFPFAGTEIDLTEMIQEQVVIGVPAWPECDESCKGLCPGCGKDLNRGSCGCETETVDPRFAVLKKLKLDK